jgi:fido (protein-threonine AMPylation protein)
LPTPWNADPPTAGALLRGRLRTLALEMLDEAPRRPLPTVAHAQVWHWRLFERLAPERYAGNIRDSDPALPELDGYEVMVGDRPGLPAAAVPQALEKFEQTVQQATLILDTVIPRQTPPATRAHLQGVLALCGLVHGEWIRIHPFANGNGRTARLWARWFALRYALPPFVRLMPRPYGDLYAGAARRSMEGDHAPTIRLFHTMLDMALRERA